jgi:hypothetical protein
MITKFYENIYNKNWDTVNYMLDENKNYAYEKSECNLETIPIFSLIKYNAPSNLIQKIINLYPDSVKISNKDNLYPLHIAFSSFMFNDNAVNIFKIIDILLELYPEAASIKTNFGLYPFHIGLFYDSNENDEDDIYYDKSMIKLLSLYPQVLNSELGEINPISDEHDIKTCLYYLIKNKKSDINYYLNEIKKLKN